MPYFVDDSPSPVGQNGNATPSSGPTFIDDTSDKPLTATEIFTKTTLADLAKLGLEGGSLGILQGDWIPAIKAHATPAKEKGITRKVAEFVAEMGAGIPLAGPVLGPLGNLAVKVAKPASKFAAGAIRGVTEGIGLGAAQTATGMTIGDDTLGDAALKVGIGGVGGGVLGGALGKLGDKFAKSSLARRYATEQILTDMNAKLGKLDEAVPIGETPSIKVGVGSSFDLDQLEASITASESRGATPLAGALATSNLEAAVASGGVSAPASPTPVGSAPSNTAAGWQSRQQKSDDNSLKKLWNQVVATFNSTSMSSGAKATGLIFRSETADTRLRDLRMTHELKGAIKYLGGKSQDEVKMFMNAMEHFTSEPSLVQALSPKDKILAESFHNILKNREAEIQGWGRLEHVIEDYFPHLWKQKDEANQIINDFFARRPMGGKASFLKKRTKAYFSDGLEAGLEPLTWNPGEMVLLATRQMDKFLEGQRLKSRLIEVGLAKYFGTGSTKIPKDWLPIDQRIFKQYGAPQYNIYSAFDQNVMDGLANIAQKLGISQVRLTKIGRGSKTWGLADLEKNKIYTRFGGPESILAHEIGHVLPKEIPVLNQLVNDPAYLAEITALAAERHNFIKGGPPSKTFAEYVQKPSERLAVMLEALVHAPEIFATKAPNLFAKYTQALALHPIARELLQVKPSLTLGTEKSTIKGMVSKLGQWYAPPDVVRIIDNYYSPGLQGKPIYDAVRGMGNMLNAAQLGLSLFHFAFVLGEASMSTAALGMKQIVDGLTGAAPKKFIGTGLKNIAEIFTVLGPGIREFRSGSKLMKEALTEGSVGGQTAELLKHIIEAGQSAKMEDFWRTNADKRVLSLVSAAKTYFKSGEKMKGVDASTRALLNVMPAFFEVTSRPLLDFFVPRLKLGVMGKLLEYELARMPDAIKNIPLLRQERLAKISDTVDNRIGQIVYNNLFWQRTIKDIGLMMTRSLGWNLGTYREVIGGSGPDVYNLGIGLSRMIRKGGPIEYSKEFTHRTAYVMSLVWVTALYGAMLNYAFTGEPPQEKRDYYFPRTGLQNNDGSDGRISLPTYMKDLFHYGKDPWATLKGKINPVFPWTYQMLEGKDYFGALIHDYTQDEFSDYPILDKFYDYMMFTAAQFKPITIRNMETAADQQDSTGVYSLLGLTPAPRYVTRDPEMERAFQLRRDLPAVRRHRSQDAKSENRPSIFEPIVPKWFME